MPVLSPAGLLVTHDAAAGQPDLWSGVLLLGVVVAIMYFVAWRPQSQERKAHEAMIAALVRDDKIVTSSGIHGRVVDVGADTVVREIAEKTRVTVDRSAVARKAGTPEPKKGV
jgi:preprotein translocase subunit YajC